MIMCNLKALILNISNQLTMSIFFYKKRWNGSVPQISVYGIVMWNIDALALTDENNY